MKQTIFCQNCKEPYINNKSLDQEYPETKLLCPECEEKDLKTNKNINLLPSKGLYKNERG